MRVQYPTAFLNKEKRLIRESVQNAWYRLLSENYQKSLGLAENDPPALWRWRLKKAPWIDKSGVPIWPDKDKFFEKLSLRETVEELIRQAFNDEQLEVWLKRLLAPIGHETGRLKRLTKEQRFVLRNWIQADDHPNFFQASLSFYSNLSLAQYLYFHRWKKPLPASRIGRAEKTAAKVVERLHLRAASKRLFRKLVFEKGNLHFVPFDTRRG